MYKSILEFIEKGTTKIEKITKESLLSGNMMCFEEELFDTVLGFGRSLYQEILESIEQTIRNSEVRRQSYYVEHKEDHRTLLTRFGNLEIKRAYYSSKQDGKGVYLLDKYIGLDSNEKVSLAAKAHALREAVETSYRKGGEEACLTDDVVTKQTVKNLIHDLEVEMPEEIPEKKKQIKTLHIQADEDHVALQFYRKKGDLQISENGRKSNTVMPKLILLYEDIMEEGKPGSKRYRLTGKHYFGGVYEGAEANEDLEEVERLLRKCGANAVTPGKQKEIEACQKYIQNNWLGIIVRYDDAGADWGCSAEGQISHVLSARESSRPMGWSKLGVHKMTQLRVFTRNGGKVTDLLEYQHKKEQKEKRIARQDELVREVKKSHKISGEEIVRKEIPGLERASFREGKIEGKVEILYEELHMTVAEIAEKLVISEEEVQKIVDASK